MRFSLLLSITVAFFASGYAFAVPKCSSALQEADALFANRGDGLDTIHSAVAKYESAIPLCTGYNLVYAVEQISRLDAYGGKLIPITEPERRIVEFEHCIRTIEAISPTQFQVTPEYNYWKAVCIGFWLEAVGAEGLSRSQDIYDLAVEGLSIDPTYEGGGFNRVLGGLYSKMPRFNPFGPSRDFAKAVQNFTQSIAAPAYSRSRHPETSTGEYFYESYFYLAETYSKMEDRSRALQILEEAMDRIDTGDLPVLRGPETTRVRRSMQELWNQLTGP